MAGAIIAVILGLLLIGFFVASFFLRRYRDTDRPQSGWHATDEVFSDPSTKRVMRVWLDAAGNRHYVAERRSEQSP